MGNAKFEVDPHNGAGPIRFGMTRAEVKQAMGKTPERGRKGGKLAIAQYDYFKDDGIFVYYDPTDRAIAAEFFDFDELAYPPDGTFAGPFAEVLDWVKAHDPNVTVQTGDHFRSEALGIAGAPREDDSKNNAESIIVFRPKYYEDSKRWRQEKQEEPPLVEKKSEPRPYEVAPSSEFQERYGYTAENRTPIKLDPAVVPERFRHLIPDAELVGESDDVIRADILEKLSPEAKQAIEARLRPVQGDLLDWVIELQDKGNLGAEWSAFSALLESFG